jgi:Xaa-Pro aminopeptidase
MQRDNLLLIADSERDADILYATRLFVPDPFIYFRLCGRDHIVMSDLEIDRARKQAPHCRVIALTACQKKLRAAGVARPGLAEVTALLLKQHGVKKISVPESFPLGLATKLAKLKIKVVAVDGGIFPQREIKSAAEVKKLSAALAMAEAGMTAGIAAVRAAKIGRGRKLLLRAAPLTSERLRSIIDTAVLQAGGLAANTIVAGGIQGCDPHERGHGQLFAHEPIILDIFPRAQATGYFGDITRTVVKGRATEAARKLYATVFDGQKIGFDKIRDGAPTNEVHAAVVKLFSDRGYKTGARNGRMEGFFHGTGHGLGLEIHEAPRMGATSTGKLKAGQVVTVEPGLYYPGIGGVRLEDVAVVQRNGARNLTRMEKVFEA